MPRRARTTVYVADDHPLYREGVVDAVKRRPDLELVGESEDGSTAIDDIRRLEPDVAVLDVRLPGLLGTQVLSVMTQQEMPTRAVLLSAHVDSEIVYEAIEAGAAGYLSKAATRDEICDAIAAAARGETVLAEETHGGLAGEIRRRKDHDGPRLSPREHEVLSLTADGLSAQEIGVRLHVSAGTVKTHLQRIYDKLEVRDRAAAVAEGLRRGLLQ